ncbi:hypothetical protein [Candidatus Poriferisodalis sp.]|uniref:hypothetical protein n=1 Tax=Candidatus Poriferisodalis sp. TaxID=3101277 RepID=UPI003B52C105
MTDTKHDQDHRAELDAERAVNEQYLAEIERLLDKQPHLVKQIAVVQSQQWTTSSLPRPGIDRGATAAVIGRVALEDDHPYSDVMGQTFYIAGWRVEKDGFETVNWAAPIASLYFEGRSSGYPIASSVTGRRTFVLRLADLVDYTDEIETAVADPFKGRAGALEIPAAPMRRRPTVEPTEEEQTPPEPEAAEFDEPPRIEPSEPFVAEIAREVDTRLEHLRAADAVVKVMQMPKQGRMGAVLPTMQPDQYQLVAAAGNRGLVVQGQPGTGKTVVAAHRAVYLTSSERESERVARIAIVGPSDHYVEHVAPIVSELKEPEAEIRVLSLPALLRKVAGLRSVLKPGPIGRIESSWALGRMIDQFVRSMDDRPASGRIDQRVRRVVEAMKHASESEIGDAEVLAWLRGLPSWNEISGQVRYLPMLATVALSLDPSAIGEWVGHLIVDEAQDVRPLEWRILTSSLLEHGGSLSLFGEMNQRRSDWTAASWQKLAVDLEMTDDTGHCDIHVLQMGYRSTQQILRFANQLLPRGERGEQALRNGPQPTITRVSADGRTAAAVDAAIDLANRHTGMVAVISTEPRPPLVEFRKRGWIRGRYQHSWTWDGATVVILHPDEARGLEFDGAVVVEPRDFPENVGRQGVLYTSLTRANKELAVVHAQPLPRGLRPPR